MTNWRAVGIGFVVLFVAGALATALPVIGHIGAGLLGGFAAGYVAGGGLTNGAWHGLLAGAIGGIAVAAVFALVVGVLGVAVGGPFGGAVGFGGVLFGGAAIALLLAIDSAIAGAIGALVAD